MRTCLVLKNCSENFASWDVLPLDRWQTQKTKLNFFPLSHTRYVPVDLRSKVTMYFMGSCTAFHWWRSGVEGFVHNCWYSVFYCFGIKKFGNWDIFNNFFLNRSNEFIKMNVNDPRILVIRYKFDSKQKIKFLRRSFRVVYQYEDFKTIYPDLI